MAGLDATIAPGGIVTPMTAQALAELPQDHAGLDQANNHGMGQPIDIANMVLYLACEDGRHLTGTRIVTMVIAIAAFSGLWSMVDFFKFSNYFWLHVPLCFICSKIMQDRSLIFHRF